MNRFTKTALATTALATCLSLPATAQQNQEMSADAQACVERLEAMDQRLNDVGYGRMGPGGYGAYGAPYGTADDGAAEGTLRGGALGTWGATPASDMRALMRSGYIMANQGYSEGCEAVVATVEDIGNRYEEAITAGDADELAAWRGEFLGATTSVAELEQPLTVDEILGADVRNLQDEDLGDIDDVVMNRDGGIRYVIVETGGFLGIGDDEVPVRWNDLQLVTGTYGDTFVLDVSEQAFDDAPRLEEREATELLAEDRSAEVDTYWDEAGIGQNLK